jgi:hypothetical protein
MLAAGISADCAHTWIPAQLRKAKILQSTTKEKKNRTPFAVMNEIMREDR